VNDQENTLKKVAQKGFSGKNFLEVTCYIEIDASNPKYTRLKETIEKTSPDHEKDGTVFLDEQHRFDCTAKRRH
jgi:hypothetical protein